MIIRMLERSIRSCGRFFAVGSSSILHIGASHYGKRPDEIGAGKWRVDIVVTPFYLLFISILTSFYLLF